MTKQLKNLLLSLNVVLFAGALLIMQGCMPDSMSKWNVEKVPEPIVTPIPVTVKTPITGLSYGVTTYNATVGTYFMLLPTITPSSADATPFTFTSSSAILHGTPCNAGGINGIFLDDGFGTCSGIPGAIYGTALAVQTATTYIIRVTDSYSPARTATTSIQFSASYPTPPTGLTYPQAIYNFKTGVDVGSSIIPSLTGGSATGYSLLTGSLPSGLSLNTTTGAITGAATSSFTATPYTIVASNIGGSASYTVTLSSTTPPAALYYTEPGTLPSTYKMRITLNTAMTASGAQTFSFSTPLSGRVTVAALATSVVGSGTNFLNEVRAFLTSGQFLNINIQNQLLGITLPADVASATSITLSSGPTIAANNLKATANYITTATVGSYSTPYKTADITFSSTTKALVPIGATTSLAGQTVVAVSHVYSDGETVNLSPTIIDNDSVTYSISGTLPSNLTFDTSTGIISGIMGPTFTTTTVTITATNNVGSVQTTFSIARTIPAPTDLAYADMAIIQVRDTSSFKIGGYISSEDGALGRVRAISSASRSFVLAELLSGTFKRDDSIDNQKKWDGGQTDTSEFYRLTVANGTLVLGPVTGNSSGATGTLTQIDPISGSSLYYAYVKALTGSFSGTELLNDDVAHTATISQVANDDVVIPVNAVLSVGSVSGFTRNGYITSSAGYQGLVSAIDGNLLYIRSTLNGVSPTNIAIGTGALNIGNTLPYSLATTTATLAAKDLTLITTANYAAGSEITSELNGSGYIWQKKGSSSPYSLFVRNFGSLDPTNSNPIFSSIAGSSGIGNVNPYGANNTTATTSPSATFLAYVGEEFNLIAKPWPDMQLTYFSIPALPSGLALDSSTGAISGTPTAQMPETTYTIAAVNSDNKSITSYVKIVIKRKVELSEEANAPSFIMHKDGFNNQTRPCLFDESILSSTNPPVMFCRLDAGELDLYGHGMKLQYMVNAGLCDHIRYRPYYFYSWPTATSTITTQTTSVASTYFNHKDQCTVSTASAPVGQSVGISGWYKTARANPPLLSLETTAMLDPTDLTDKTNRHCRADWRHEGGPNCDTGYYRIITVTWQNNAGNNGCELTDDAPGTLVSCGGDFNNCIEGPQKDSGSGYAENFSANHMKAQIKSTSPNADTIYTLDYTGITGLTKDLNTNLYHANYTNMNQCTSTYSYSGTAIAPIPNTANILNGNQWPADFSAPGRTSPWQNAYPYYTFECLDSAFATKATIHLQVREFDDAFGFTDAIDRTVVPGNIMDDATTITTQLLDWDNDYTTNMNNYGNTNAGSYNAGGCWMRSGGTEYAFPANEL